VAERRGSVREVFRAFLKLGLTSFGGPVAHLGYFRDELVLRRRWMDEASYADLVGLCQFLPGPASSQVGFAMGLRRAGPVGALAAWSAFTLPSALFLIAFAYWASAFDGPVGQAVIHGLKLVAVAVVAHAVWGMAHALAPDRSRAAIALGALLLVTLAGGAVGQIGAILLGAAAGLWLARGADVPPPPADLGLRTPPAFGLAALALFASLLLGLPLLVIATDWQAVALFDAFYRAGALVFGGGHVVLPLLEAEMAGPGWLSQDAFLAGYGAAQAVPGPLFTFAAYLGAAAIPEPNGLAGAAIALVGIFLPGMLVLVGALPFWDRLRQRLAAQASLRGINAAVVGILAAALYDPVWTSAIFNSYDFAVAAIAFLALVRWRVPPWTVVLGTVLASAARLLLIG